MKVSIMIPCHNRAENTKRLLDALMKQRKEYPQTEIIVVENGSNEDMSFLDKYPIILDHCEKGISIARNRGLDLATGDYYCFIDNDDSIPEYYLKVVYENIEFEYDWYIWQWWSDNTLIKMDDLDIIDPLKHQWALWGYCFNKKLFDNFRFSEDDVVADRDVFRIITKESKGFFIKLPMYRYWWNGNEESFCHIYNANNSQ